jgi:hypothetical protein
MEPPPSALTNAPESQDLSPEDEALFEAARTAVAGVKRTYEDYWRPLAKMAVRARELADLERGKKGSGKAFRRILDQQGLGAIKTATANKLVKMGKKLDEVDAWREPLTPNEKFEWAGLSSILARCPALAPEPKSKSSSSKKRKARDPDPIFEIGEAIDAARDVISKNLPDNDADNRGIVLAQLVADFSDEELEAELSSRRSRKGNGEQADEAREEVGDEH